MKPEKLPFGNTIYLSYEMPFSEIGTLWRIALVPFCLYFFSGFLFGFIRSAGLDVWDMFPGLLQWFFLTVFAVSWHRLVLLNPDRSNVRKKIGIDISEREVAFFCYSFVYVAVLMAPFYIGQSQTFRSYFYSDSATLAVLLFSFWPIFATPFVVRLALVFPAAAIERRISFAQSWRMTRGNTWRIVGILILCGLPMPILNRVIISPLAVQAHGSVLGFTIVELVWLVLLFMQTAIAATAVSTIYRRIVERETANDLVHVF